MKTGLYISGIAHTALILWLLFGGWLMQSDQDTLLQVSEVTLMSGEEFAALTQPTPESVAPEAAPAAPPRPEPPASEPDPAPEPAPEPAAPAPAPLPTPTPAPSPDPEVAPVPQDAPRVAPVAAPEPDPQAEIAETVTQEVAPSQQADVVVEEAPATAPEAATTEIVTEAETPASAAPLTSQRPRARPDRPRPATPTPTPTPDAADAIADAVAAVVADQPAPTTARAVPSGPPLSRGERDGLRVAVGNCWNVGSLSTDAMRTTVVVGVSMNRDAKPDIASIRLLSHVGGSDAAAQQAYETARRAIIRCGATGYNLPSDKYSQWQEIEMTFNPENMRIK